MPQKSRSARVLPPSFPIMAADLSQALDALELLAEALAQSQGKKKPMRQQANVMAVVEALRRKHNRDPAPNPWSA